MPGCFMHLLFMLQNTEWSCERSGLISMVRMEGFPLKTVRLKNSHLIKWQLHKEMMEVCLLSLKLYLNKTQK